MTKRRCFLWCFVCVLLSLSAAPADDSLRLVERGNEAFERGDYAAALGHYTSAEAQITDPGLVSFNKAATLYRLGRYRDAERHYLQCVESAPPARAVAALYNAGNAVLHRAGGLYVNRIEAAIELYEQALQRARNHQIPGDDASHNLQLAREMLAKAKQQASRNQANDGDHQRRADDSKAESATAQSGGKDPGSNTVSIGERAGDGSREGMAADHRPPPGVGNLPVLPDTDDVVALSAADTAAYLEQIAARVQRERLEHRRRHVRPVPANVRDW